MRRLRYWQFSFQLLIVLVLMLACVFAWSRAGIRERSIASAIEASGAEVVWKNRTDGHYSRFDLSNRITGVYWGGEDNLTAEDFRLLRDLDYVVEVDLSRTNVTDTLLESLAGIKSIVHLNLSGTAVTHASIPTFQSFPRLQRLTIDGTVLNEHRLKSSISKLSIAAH